MDKDQITQKWVPFKEGLEEAPFGRTSMYEYMNKGEIRARKCGNRTLLWLPDIYSLVDSFPAYRPRTYRVIRQHERLQGTNSESMGHATLRNAAVKKSQDQ